jgi:hypothetical protein
VSGRSSAVKVFEDKVSAQLHDAQSQFEKIEARGKEKLAQAEIDSINLLKSRRREIEKKREDLKTAGYEKAAQIKTEIEADLAQLGGALEQLGARLKTHSDVKHTSQRVKTKRDKRASR